MLKHLALSAIMLLPVPADASPVDQAEALLRHYDEAYEPAKAAWPSFDPAPIPKVIIARDNAGRMQHLLIMDHPNPAAFGPTVELPHATGKAFLVVDPLPNNIIEAVENFEFSAPLHGAPTFLIASNCGAVEMSMDCMRARDFTTYYLHEVFHRWQDDHFASLDNYVDQERYDFSPDALAAILLETDILRAAIVADDPAEKRALARQFIALREDRATRFDHVDLDHQQERIEGTAFFLELRLDPFADAAAVEEKLLAYLALGDLSSEVKWELAFGRFYASGAAILQLAISLGAEDATQQVTNGASPSDVLAKVVPVSPVERSLLIKAAKSRFDPNGSLADEAKAMAERAAKEPGIFE